MLLQSLQCSACDSMRLYCAYFTTIFGVCVAGNGLGMGLAADWE